MSVAFKAAWMLLKQRGHELNLPEPVRQNVGPHARNMSPQDLIDARVNAASKQKHALNEIEMAGTQNPRINSMDDAMAFLDNQRFNQNEMEDQLNIAQDHEGEEAYLQGEQGALDRATLAREGQQPEADEMEAMGVPEMSRRLGGRTPLNIGRAGSSDIGEETMSAMDEDVLTPEIITAFQDLNYRQRGPPNPFPKSLEGRVQDQLTEFADGAGRRAAMTPQTDFGDDLEYEDKSRIEESHPEAHNIASTTLRDTPRKTKRGQIDEPRATPRMQGRAARSSSPFIGGQ